jgi:hypothetical protein
MLLSFKGLTKSWVKIVNFFYGNETHIVFSKRIKYQCCMKMPPAYLKQIYAAEKSKKTLVEKNKD